MTKIQSKIRREKLPGAMGYPLRYTDVEDCVGVLSGEIIHLRVMFERRESWSKYERDQALIDRRYGLVQLVFQHAPPFDSFVHMLCKSNEAEGIEIGLVVSVYGAPRAEMKEAGLRRAHVRALLMDQMRVLGSEHDNLSQCRLTIHLNVKCKTLECVRAYSRYGVDERIAAEHLKL